MVLTEDGISLGLGLVYFSTFSVTKIICQSELFCVLDDVQKHFKAIGAPTDLFWKFLFSMVLGEYGISLWLGSINFSTFSPMKIICRNGLFCVLGDVPKHFKAI